MRADVRGAAVTASGRRRLSSSAVRLAVAVNRRPVLVATIVGCALYLAAASSPTTGLWSGNWQYQGDLAIYHDYAQRVLEGNVPYRDFRIEYPPAALLVFLPPLLLRNAVAHLGAPGVTYEDVFKGLMLSLGLAIVVIVATTARLWDGTRQVIAAAAVVGLSPVVLGPTALGWYDVWPTLLTLGAVALFVRGHATWAFGVLGAAIAAKLFAVVLLPLFLLHVARARGTRAVIVPAAALAGTILLFFGTVMILSPSGAWYPFSYLLDRPVEIESTAGSLVGLFRLAGWWHVDPHASFGSVNFEDSGSAHLGLAFSALGVAALLALWWRSSRFQLGRSEFVARSTAAVAIAIASSKVFSPQYLVWLVPFVALSTRRVTWVFLSVAAILTRFWFPEHWGHFNNNPPVYGLAAPRNLAVWLVALASLRATSLRPWRRTKRE